MVGECWCYHVLAVWIIWHCIRWCVQVSEISVHLNGCGWELLNTGYPDCWAWRIWRKAFGLTHHESMLKKAIAQATHCCYINTTIDNFSSGSSASILCYMFAYTSWRWNWVQGLFVLASPDMSKTNNLVSWLLAPSRACRLRAKLGLMAIFKRCESVFNDFNDFLSLAKVEWRAPGELLRILQFESNPKDALAESETTGET